jgi:hypothetical protein
MKRQANWTPVIVSNRLLDERGAVRLTDDAVTSAAAAPPIIYMTAPKGDTTKSLDQQNQRRADLQFSIGVTVAFALPVIIALVFK